MQNRDISNEIKRTRGLIKLYTLQRDYYKIDQLKHKLKELKKETKIC